MLHRPSFKTFLTTIAICTFLLSSYSQVWADELDEVKPLVLRKIMRDIGKSMQNVTDGISREDWDMVGTAAQLIADHPEPPLLEKMRVLRFVGVDAANFKELDERTHKEARALMQAALRSDGQAAISSFASLQNSCLACHQSFRKPFVEHFYGQR